jgi:hypothetical protein
LSLAHGTTGRMPQVTSQPAASTSSRRSYLVPARKALPDACAIRAVPLPQLAPPYDDDPVRSSVRVQAVARASRPTAAGARSLTRAGRLTTRPPAASQVKVGREISGQDREPVRTPMRPAGTGDWPSHFAQILAETLAGARPADQLSAWTTEEARKRISQLGPLLAATNRPRVRRVIITSPAGGVLEMTIVVSLGARARAVAVRLELRPRPAAHSSGTREAQPPRWRCTEIEAA